MPEKNARLVPATHRDRKKYEAAIRGTRENKEDAGCRDWWPTVSDPTIRAEQLRCVILSSGLSQTFRQLSDKSTFSGRKGADLRRAITRLEDYCAKARIGKAVLAITSVDAANFQRHLLKQKLSVRTVNNYRRSLVMLWDIAIKRDTASMTSKKQIRDGSTLLDNPWRLCKGEDLFLTTGGGNGSVKLQSQHDPRRSAALKFAISVKPYLERLDPGRTLSNKELARRLIAEGVKTRRGTQYDATAVRRIKALIRWKPK